MPSLARFAAAFAACLFVDLANAKACPPLGPVLPAPQSPSQNEAVQSALEKLKSALDSQFTGTLNTSGVSIGIKSIHETDQLFDYHYTPPVLSGIGTNSIDKNTIYRVGSLSKIFPALAALQSPSIDTRASILKYIPELQNSTGTNAINTNPWSDITVASLMGHLAGLATDTAFDLAVFGDLPWTDMGLPGIANGTGPSCSGLPGTAACTKQNLIDDLKRRAPIWLPFTGPSYSNIGFALVALIIEAVTAKTFEEVIQAGIYDVIGMNSSSFNGPVLSFSTEGFVPVDETTWNVTLGVFEGAGGMFSNTVDLIAFAEGVINNSLLPARQTREWLKPDTHTSSLGYSVGAPWEILRSDSVTSDRRLVDFYTKSGDLGLYHAVLAIVPDYDVVISLLTGGAEVSADIYASQKIFSAVVETVIPAIEQAGRDEASSSTGFVGTYVDASTGSTLVLGLDAGPGLVVSNFTVRGYDVLNHTSQYVLGTTNPFAPADAFVDGRLYPTNLVAKSAPCGAGSQTDQVAWRGYFDTTTDAEKQEVDAALFYKSGSCQTWTTLDRTAYDFLSVWEFVFAKGADGQVTGVQNPSFNITLTKAELS